MANENTVFIFDFAEPHPIYYLNIVKDEHRGKQKHSFHVCLYQAAAYRRKAKGNTGTNKIHKFLYKVHYLCGIHSSEVSCMGYQVISFLL